MKEIEIEKKGNTKIPKEGRQKEKWKKKNKSFNLFL
jgi:hypothetical protein